MDTTDTERAGYTSGLRRLADLLDANPNLPLPSYGREGTPLLAYVAPYNYDAKAVLAAWARAVGKAEKRTDNGYFNLHFVLDGLHLQVYSSRDAVCERIVTGTETVTVPAVEAKPERVETREIVEWRCSPLLAEAVSS